MLSMFVSGLLLTAGAATSDIKAVSCQFGEARQGQPAECLAEFINASDRERRFRLVPVGEHDPADETEFKIGPKATAQVHLKARTLRDTGIVAKGFRFTAVDDDKLTGIVEARGFIRTALDVAKPELDLGVVDLLEQAKPVTFDFKSEEDPGLRATAIDKAPDFVTATLAQDGRALVVTPKPGAMLGLRTELVHVKLNSTKQPTATVRIRADLHGSVVPSANPLELGLIREGAGNDGALRLTSRKNEKVEIDRIELSGIKGETRQRDCTPAADSCREVRVRVLPGQPTGYLDGKLDVYLKSQDKPVRVQLWGLLVKKDTVIKDFDKEVEAQAAAQPKPPEPGAQSAARPGATLFDTLKETARKSEPIPAPPGAGPVLRWQASNEGRVYGYAIFRADLEEGPFALVSADYIKPDPEMHGEGSYAWRDTTAKPETVYWYYIGIVTRHGERERLTVPQRVRTKPAQP